MTAFNPQRPSGRSRYAAGLAAALLASLAVAASSSAAPAAATTPPVAAPAAGAVLTPIDINTASEAELLALPRVGPALAKRIVEHRKAAGGFRKVDELANVKGVGERTLALLRPLVTVSAAAKPAPAGTEGRP